MATGAKGAEGMGAGTRIEEALVAAIAAADGPTCPPGLAAAMRYTVFPGGARVRPKLCLAVALACGDDRPELSNAAAAAIELLHCASLVHDDLPCFDNAALRRGKPSVHCTFGEPLAVLTGDALIVLAFETLARAAGAAPERLGPLVSIVGRGVGAPFGLCAGQAWESEPTAPLREYQRAKTGALFIAATAAGAAAAGADPAPWRALGDRLGEAYQVADDLKDALEDAATIGKPVGVDAALDRPNAVSELGVEGAVGRLKQLIGGALAAIPDCPGAAMLEAIVKGEAERLAPTKAVAEKRRVRVAA
jgi:geranylgeranyl diphosphate synthase, type II